MGGPTILVVDDEPEIRQLVRVMLDDVPGALVFEACDALEAVDGARHYRPNIVILDAMMPDMRGEDVIPLIRRIVPNALIVLFSALEPDRIEQMAREAGVPAFGKPQVSEMIEFVLEQTRVS